MRYRSLFCLLNKNLWKLLCLKIYVKMKSQVNFQISSVTFEGLEDATTYSVEYHEIPRGLNNVICASMNLLHSIFCKLWVEKNPIFRRK